MNVLAIDIGGTHVKFLVSGEKEARKFPSGLTMSPGRMSRESRN
jgi:polyphosphate glucokinase